MFTLRCSIRVDGLIDSIQIPRQNRRLRRRIDIHQLPAYVYYTNGTTFAALSRARAGVYRRPNVNVSHAAVISNALVALPKR